MSFTGNWMFDEINRGADVGTSGGLVMRRNAWSLTRHRFSDEAYVSDLGTIEATISGLNGGVIETVAAPPRSQLTFGTDQDWINTTDVFIEAGYVVNQRPVYAMDLGQRSKFSPSQTMVVYGVKGSPTGISATWVCAQFPPEFASLGSLPIDTAQDTFPKSLRANGDFYMLSAADYLTPHGIEFTGITSFSGASTATISSAAGSFFCSGDVQSYSQEGVDWFKQTQTWTYRDAWRAV